MSAPSDAPTFPADLLRALRARPLVPLVVALVAGVVTADRFPGRPELWMLTAALWAALAVALARSPRSYYALLLASASLGGALQSLALTPPRHDISALAGASGAEVEGTVVAVLRQSAGHAEAVVDVRRALLATGLAPPAAGRALVELYGDARRVRPAATLTFGEAKIALVPAARNWGQTDRRRALARQGIHTIITAQQVTAVADPGRARLVDLRERMIRILTRAPPGSEAERDGHLLAAMLFGNAAVGVDEDSRDLFRVTGTIHLLVVSGTQVSIIFGFVALFTGGRRPVIWWQAVPAALLVLAFGLLVGLRPSVLRALLMCALWLGAMCSGRRYDLLTSVALSAGILVLTRPGVVFDAGAQITYAAVLGIAGILVRSPRTRLGERRRVGAVPRVLLWVARGTLGAWLFTTPLLAHYFHSFALLGSVANLVAVPLAVVLVVLGLVAVLAGLICPPLAVGLCLLARGPLWVILTVNHACARLPLAFVDRISLSPAGCLLWLLGVALAVYWVRSGLVARLWDRRPGTVVALATGLLALAVVVFGLRQLWPRPCRIMTFDVGEGQCTLVETPERRVIMLDAGTRRELSNYSLANEVVLPYLLQRGLREIDLLVLSHPDFDHYGAARFLCRRMPVHLALTCGREGTEQYAATLAALQDSGAQVLVAQAGTRVQVGSARVAILSPPPGARPEGVFALANNAALVTRVECGGVSALVPADLEVDGMAYLLATTPRASLAADFLQVPHHGRDSANLPAFFGAVNPRVAVVSRYGEPAIRLAQQSVARICSHLYDTEQTGAVLADADGGALVVRTYLASPAK